MAGYTAREYVDMIIAYGIAGENAVGAARVYAERFPERERHPDDKVISRCVQRARDTGSVVWNRRNAGAPMQIRVNDEERILQVFEEHPKYSVRYVSRLLGFSRYKVHSVLRRNRQHPYHHQGVQQLFPRDQEHRIYFCEGIFI